jgi:hypothetical protein
MSQALWAAETLNFPLSTHAPAAKPLPAAPLSTLPVHPCVPCCARGWPQPLQHKTRKSLNAHQQHECCQRLPVCSAHTPQASPDPSKQQVQTTPTFRYAPAATLPLLAAPPSAPPEPPGVLCCNPSCSNPNPHAHRASLCAHSHPGATYEQHM